MDSIDEYALELEKLEVAKQQMAATTEQAKYSRLMVERQEEANRIKHQTQTKTHARFPSLHAKTAADWNQEKRQMSNYFKDLKIIDSRGKIKKILATTPETHVHEILKSILNRQFPSRHPAIPLAASVSESSVMLPCVW